MSNPTLDIAQRIAEPVAICGDNPVLPARIVGCGKPIEDVASLYRCTHCDVPFHKACANKHFSDGDVLTEEHINSMTDEEVQLAAAALGRGRNG
jgi:hypothetical protein